MMKSSRRLFYINPADWTWWAWTITTVLLIMGLSGFGPAFIAAMAVTAGQGILLLVRDRSPAAISVQIRAAYLLLMSYPSPMHWFYWLLTVGTIALIVFGYCTMARLLSLFPWNSHEAYTLDRLRRTFFSAPDLDRLSTDSAAAGCAGGLCTIEAQVEKPNHLARA